MPEFHLRTASDDNFLHFFPRSTIAHSTLVLRRAVRKGGAAGDGCAAGIPFPPRSYPKQRPAGPNNTNHRGDLRARENDASWTRSAGTGADSHRPKRPRHGGAWVRDSPARGIFCLSLLQRNSVTPTGETKGKTTTTFVGDEH